MSARSACTAGTSVAGLRARMAASRIASPQRGVAAREHHGELVVTQRLLTHVGLRGSAFEEVQLAAKRDVAADEIEGAMPGDLEKPRPRLGGHAAEGPRLERADERVLHGL